MRVWPGRPYPLGATYTGNGTNFSLFSEVADRVELCLYDDRGHETRVEMPEVSDYVWHAHVPDVDPGQRYAYRVYGPWDPGARHRCHGSKLLLDPYAKVIEGLVQWDDALFPRTHHPHRPPNTGDSGPFMPKGMVSNPYYDWLDDHSPNTSLRNTVIYEAHVKGLTQRHPDVPPDLRGTYLGLAEEPVIEHLTHLGVTAIELMPVHYFVHDRHLIDRGLRNYWGCNTIGFFALHNEYATQSREARAPSEFKQMVYRLHKAGLEVILDVVYNHTAEGNHLGPFLSFKGIDNATYYRLNPDDRRYYMDYTGTGNSLDMRYPHVLQLVMDSLRYWVQEMHVDGFRFDLAAALARELFDVNRLAAFFDVIHQDPVISQVKLIAEPWDVGEGGYQVGRFPPLWSEWNGRYRDTVRDYWRGAECCGIDEFALRLTGSPDLYEGTGRRPHASINFITAHDGFTLHDMVTYEHKHNEANCEGGRDGTDDNRSRNYGVEGETSDPQINALRARQKRNLLATLLLSQGVPMLLSGDEIGRTQKGNNNAYCQDSELTWLDWENADWELYEYVSGIVRLLLGHPVFRRRSWFTGRAVRGEQRVGWHRPDAVPMSEEDWNVRYAKALQVYLSGDIGTVDDRGNPIIDDDFVIMFNAAEQALTFTVPAIWRSDGCEWKRVLDTNVPELDADAPASLAGAYRTGDPVDLEAHSMVVLCHTRDAQEA